MELKNFKKLIPWLALGLLIIFFIFIIRSCSLHEMPRKKLFLVGRDSSFYPLQLMGKERNLQAFTNDLMAAISTDTGLIFQWVDTGPATLISGLTSGNYDAIITSMRPNVVNQDRYVFSDLIFEIGPILVVQKNSTVTSLKDMDGKTIGVRAGTSLIFNAIRQSGANVYDPVFVAFETLNRALDALVGNHIDGVIIDAIQAYTLMDGYYQGTLKAVTPPLTDEGLRLVAIKGGPSDDLIPIFNAALIELKENGTYDKLITKWNLIDAEIRYKNYLQRKLTP